MCNIPLYKCVIIYLLGPLLMLTETVSCLLLLLIALQQIILCLHHFFHYISRSGISVFSCARYCQITLREGCKLVQSLCQALYGSTQLHTSFKVDSVCRSYELRVSLSGRMIQIF